MPSKYTKMFFGQHLCNKGLITFEDTIRARALQNSQNSRLGDIAKERGWLSDREIERVLVIQEETNRKFGEIAVDEGFLSKAQVEELVRKQKDNYLRFGEALVKLGLMKEREMLINLRAFIEIEKQLRKAVKRR